MPRGIACPVRRGPLDATLLEWRTRSRVRINSCYQTWPTTTVASRRRSFSRTAADLAAALRWSVHRQATFAGHPKRNPAAQDGERKLAGSAIYYRYVCGTLPPPGGWSLRTVRSSPNWQTRRPYVFPSDAGLTCIAISVNLREYERLRHDAQARFDTAAAPAPRTVGPLCRQPSEGDCSVRASRTTYVDPPVPDGPSSETRGFTRTRGPVPAWTAPPPPQLSSGRDLPRRPLDRTPG